MDEVIFKKINERLSVSNEKDFNIYSSNIKRKAKQASKGEKCLLCDKECSSFCGSHSIPKFVLNNIATNGKVLAGYELICKRELSKPIGIKNFLTFSSICLKCDNEYFREYENEDFFHKPLSTLAINEIAVKNYLRYLDKRKNDLYQYIFLLEEAHQRNDFGSQIFISELNNSIQVARIDIKMYEDCILEIKKNKEKNFFYVIDEIDLDYNTKFAYQGFVALVNGFDERIINNIYNYDLKYKIQKLGIAIFPCSNSTKILLFCKNGDNRLRLFYKRYRQLTLEEKLYAINYILLLNEEDWCVPGDFKFGDLNKETVSLMGEIKDAMLKTQNPFISRDNVNRIIAENLGTRYVIKCKGNIYNFLEKRD